MQRPNLHVMSDCETSRRVKKALKLFAEGVQLLQISNSNSKVSELMPVVRKLSEGILTDHRCVPIQDLLPYLEVLTPVLQCADVSRNYAKKLGLNESDELYLFVFFAHMSFYLAFMGRATNIASQNFDFFRMQMTLSIQAMDNVCLKIKPNDPYLLYLREQYYRNLDPEDVTSLIEKMKHIISIDPNFFDSYYMLGTTLYNLSDPSNPNRQQNMMDAVKYCKKYLEIAPKEDIYYSTVSYLMVLAHQVEFVQTASTSMMEVAQNYPEAVTGGFQYLEMAIQSEKYWTRGPNLSSTSSPNSGSKWPVQKDEAITLMQSYYEMNISLPEPIRKNGWPESYPKRCCNDYCKKTRDDSTLKNCTRCKRSWYCSVDCQKADWYKEAFPHKQFCKTT